MAAPAHRESYEPPRKAAYIVGVFAVDEKGMRPTSSARKTRLRRTRCTSATSGSSRWVGDTFGRIAERLRDLAAQCRATNGAGLFVREELLRHALVAGLDAHPIPTEFKPEERLLTVSGHAAGDGAGSRVG